jgi:hypothetical protein
MEGLVVIVCTIVERAWLLAEVVTPIHCGGGYPDTLKTGN